MRTERPHYGVSLVASLFALTDATTTAHTWVVGPILKIVGAFEQSVKQHPLIPMGTPDPYSPPK